MGLFRRYHPRDILYLMPVKLGSEQLPRDKIRMLYCDAAGEVCTRLVERSDYEVARRNVRKMERTCQGYATIGLEINPGRLVPLVVEVGEAELWALEHILEHVLLRGIIPDVLKKYPRQIIRLGEARRLEVAARYERRERRSATTPRVLHRLPYYPEEDIEVSIPIYKAEHRYPLVALKRITPNEQTPEHMQRLLILDSDGDLAIIRVPLESFNRAEKELERWKKKSGQDGCVIYSQHTKGFYASHLPISELQRNALNVITEYFEKTGQAQQPVPSDVSALLSQAKGVVASHGL